MSLAIGTWYITLVHTQRQALDRYGALLVASSLLERVQADKKIPDYYDPKGLYTVSWGEHRGDYVDLFTVHVRWHKHSSVGTVILTTGVAT